MRGIKFIIGLSICLSSSNGLAQRNNLRINGQLTLSPSYVFGAREGNFHFHGSSDLFVSNHFSISGSGYFFLGTLTSDPSVFDYNNALFFGGNYHTRSKPEGHDLYIGLQPGMDFTKLNTERNEISSSQMGFNPVFSSVIGYNYAVSTLFYFFLESRLVLGNHSLDKATNINEIKFSAGLGFSLSKKAGTPFLN